MRRQLRCLLNIERLLREDFFDRDLTSNDTVSRSIMIFNQFRDFYDEYVSRAIFSSRIDRKFKILRLNDF